MVAVVPRGAGVLVAALLITAGCIGGPSSTSPAPDSPTVTDTKSPVGTGGFPWDLRMRNYGNSTADMNVTVTYNKTGEEIFSRDTTLEPEENVDESLTFPEPGNYTVRATVSGTTREYTWYIEHTPPSWELIVTADDGEVYFTESVA